MAKTLKIVIKNTHNPAATPVGGKYPVDIIRKRLLADEVYPTNARLNGGKTQYTPDGGATWLDAPWLDPRLTTGLPKRSESAKNCPAALSIAEYFRKYITLVTSILTAGSSLVQGASLLLGFLKLLGDYGILWDIIAGLFGTLTGYTATQVNTAFSTDQYDKLAQILYCVLIDGQLDANGLLVVKQQVTEKLNATAAPIVNLMLDVMGFAGVNRAATFYTIAGSCSGFPSCDWSFCVDLTWLDPLTEPMPSPAYSTTFSMNQQPAYGGLGSYLGHPSLRGILLNGFNQAAFSRALPFNIPAGSSLTNVKIWYKSDNTNQDAFVIWISDLSVWTNPVLLQGAFKANPYIWVVNATGLHKIYFGARVNSSVSTGIFIHQIELNGTGPRPSIPSVPKWFA